MSIASLALMASVTLTQNDEYSVIGWADTTSNGSAWYLFNNTPSAAFKPTGDIQYLNGRFNNRGDANTFPTAILSFPEQYGVTDIGYGNQTVPEPTTMLLLGLGLVGLAGVRRKFKN